VRLELARNAKYLRITNRAWALLLALLLLTTISSTVVADESVRGGTVSAMLENDMFAGRDGHYTNGIGFIWVAARGTSVPGWAEQLATLAPWFPDEGELRHEYAVGQSMFTPTNIENPNPPATERPYAGWLYGTFGVGKDSDRQFDLFAVTLGVVGPASSAGSSQKLLHRWMGSTQPEGWSTQLHNEPGIVFTADRSWRSVVRGSISNHSFDVTPSVHAALGNVFTYGGAGVALRFGNQLPIDLGTPRIQPANLGSGEFSPRSTTGWYLFVGVEGRAVARNIFLDGNTFQNSRSVERIPWVGDFQYGLVFDIWSVRISFTNVLRTREYRTQDKRDRFGAFTVSVNY
jgi:hypothetical protein